MLRYYSNLATPSEPEGWDAAQILKLENTDIKKWSCPTLTKRSQRCQRVVSQDRSIKVKAMINTMSIEDAAVIVRDEHRELTRLAETMLCPHHFGAVDGGEKVKDVVTQWKNDIKTSLRSPAQPRTTTRHVPQARTSRYQPSSASSRRQSQYSDAPTEQTSTTAVPEVQIRPWSSALNTPSTQQSSPPPPPPHRHPRHRPAPAYGTTLDADALTHVMGEFQRLSLENEALKGQNRHLRAENARLVERGAAAATEHRRTRGAYEAVEDQRSVLSEQVDGLYHEINRLREREERHLARVSALEDSVQRGSRAYRSLKKVWTADSVVPKRGGVRREGGN